MSSGKVKEKLACVSFIFPLQVVTAATAGALKAQYAAVFCYCLQTQHSKLAPHSLLNETEREQREGVAENKAVNKRMKKAFSGCLGFLQDPAAMCNNVRF